MPTINFLRRRLNKAFRSGSAPATVRAAGPFAAAFDAETLDYPTYLRRAVEIPGITCARAPISNNEVAR